MASSGSLQWAELAREATARNEPVKNPAVNELHGSTLSLSFHSTEWLQMEIKTTSKAKTIKGGRDLHSPAVGVLNPSFPQDRLLTHPAGTVVCQDALALHIFHMNTQCI